MISPDGELLDVCNLGVSLKGKLSEGSVMIKSSHGSEVLTRDSWAVVSEDESIGVGRVSNDDALAVTLGVIMHGLASVDEDLAVVLKEVRSFHAGASWLGTNKEGIVNILEGSA